jgi:hypothetical protein
MDTFHISAPTDRCSQFSLRSLLEFMTICALLFAASAVFGLTVSVCLILMAAAIWMKQGGIAICALTLALIATDWPASAGESDAPVDIGLVVFAASALCVWYRIVARRNYRGGHSAADAATKRVFSRAVNF